MPRPKRCRRVCFDPSYRYFKPQGIPLDELEKVDLRVDELEALRLADMLGLSQANAAKEMNVSQPTFNRILAGARAKVAQCLVRSSALKIAKPDNPSEISIVSESAGRTGSSRRPRRVRA